MHLSGRNGGTVDLRPLRWQFAPDAGDWDDRWLVIRGAITLDDDRTWSFTDPCLLISEAREVARWLRRVAEEQISLRPSTSELIPPLSFMEPALEFLVAGRSDEGLVVCVQLAAEGAPPWLRVTDPHDACCVVDLLLTPDQLLAAATAWTSEINALPARPWVDAG